MRDTDHCVFIDHPYLTLAAAAVIVVSGFLFSLLTPISRAQATTYYISSSGNDNAAGTSPTQAWKSIAAVNARVFGPGDSILFEGGQVFNGTLVFNSADAGIASAPVTVSSYGSGKATIDGGTGLSLSISNAGGFVITNLKLVGAGRTVNNQDGLNITNNLTGNTKLDFIRVDNLEISGFGRQGILIMGGSGKSGFRDVRVTNVISHDNGHSGLYILGQFSSTATSYAHENVYVGHVTAYNNSGVSGLTYNTGSGIVMSDVNNGVIEYCVAYNNGFLNTANGGPIGIWSWDSNNVVIQYNESHHNRTASTTDGGGFDLDGGTTNSIVQYNYSHDNDGAGFLLGQFSGARPFSGNVVRYNITQNDGRKNGFAGIHLWNGGSGVKNSDIYNNTVYLNKPVSGTPRAVRLQTATTNIRIRNNILVTANGMRLLDVTSGQTGLLFQGNDYWASGGSFVIRWNGVNYSSVSAWRNATGQEKIGSTSTGLSVDPKLTSPGGGGTIGDADLLTTLVAYRLQPTSTVIGAGLNLQSQFGINPGAHDFYNTSIPQGTKFDIGAHEFVSAPDTTPPTISITAPIGGSNVSGSVAFNASAADNVGVLGVQFKVDGVNLGAEDTSSPYGITWNTGSSTDGNHTLTATARDSAGNTAQAQSNVTVLNSLPPSIASFQASPTTINQGQSATLMWQVSGAVSLSLDQGIGSVTGSSVTVSPMATTTYTLTAVNAQGSSTATATVTVATTPPPPTQLLINPGFENGATGWIKATNGGRSVVTTESHSGTRSIQMVVSNLNTRNVYQSINVTGGLPYTASAWLKTSGVPSNGVRVELIWLNAATSLDIPPANNVIRTDVLAPSMMSSIFNGLLRLDSIFGTLAITTGWDQLTGNHIAPPNAVQLRIQLYEEVDPDNVGTAWFDDLSVTQE